MPGLFFRVENYLPLIKSIAANRRLAPTKAAKLIRDGVSLSEHLEAVASFYSGKSSDLHWQSSPEPDNEIPLTLGLYDLFIARCSGRGTNPESDCP
jgi:hypothetical protein